MWYPATVTIEAVNEPLTAEEVKRRLHVDFTDDDGDIGLLIAAARDHVEHYCNIRLAGQTISVKCDRFVDMARFPVVPVDSISSISYVDTSGGEQTLPDTVYELRSDGLNASISLKYGQSWPATQPKSRITVTAVVGANDAPPVVKHAMLLWIADAYEHRENTKLDGWTALDALLCNFRYGA